MEDQTIQQALMLLKTLSLKNIANLKQSGPDSVTLFVETCNGLICLMLASKAQDSQLHLKVYNVVQLL